MTHQLITIPELNFHHLLEEKNQINIQKHYYKLQKSNHKEEDFKASYKPIIAKELKMKKVQCFQDLIKILKSSE
jgi:hypothetical protein